MADPSTVTVRIESASTNDLNVQDVVTTSSSSDDEDLSQRKQQKKDHRATATLPPNHHRRPSRLSTDGTNSIRVPLSRPITAVSLPAKTSTYDNEWNSDTIETPISTTQRRNPSCPSISPTGIRSKPPPSQTIFTHQQVPTIFTTTSERLGNDVHPQPRRDPPRRSQSLAKQSPCSSNPASPTIPIVFLTNDILLGSIRALQNERQLCKLSVDYLIDATNMRPDELARKANVGARLPCHCGHLHSRCTLTIEFNQPYTTSTLTSSSSSTLTSSSSSLLSSTNTTTHNDYNNLTNSKLRELNRTHLGQLFSAVNRFILKAQQENKRILIYGFELTPNSPLAVIAIQYLMITDEQLSLTEATHRIYNLFPIIPLQHQQYPIMERRFQDYLKQLDRKIFPKNFIVNSISADGSSSGNENRQSSREISWESSDMSATTTNTLVTSWTTIPVTIVNNKSHRLYPARSAWDS